MSQIIGMIVYTTWPVPTSTVRKKVTRGPRNVMWSGCLRSIFSAICIIQSMPPEACRVPAQVTAAIMMYMTSVGGVPGVRPKPNTKIARPIPEMAPRARLP